MRDRVDILSMRDTDIRRLFESNGMIADFEAGKLMCYICEMPVSWDTLGALLAEQGGLKVCCNLPDCLDAVAAGRKS